MKLHTIVLAGVLAGAGCAPIYEDPVYPAATVAYAEPTVVVSTWGEPMYVYGDAYWLWRNGTWMTWGPTGWYWAAPPVYLSSWHTRRYNGWYGGYGAPGRYRGTAIRDHRWTSRGGNRPTYRSSDRASGGVRTYTPRPSVRSAPSGGGWRGGAVRGGGSMRDHRRR